MAEVSVIIPTFNRSHLVTRAIISVLYQTFTNYEVIVVDDGSTDDTNACLMQFQPYIRTITHSKNFGVSAARNSGIKASSAPFIAFLDSDDYWLPQKLGVQVKFFEKSPDAMLCQTEEKWIRNYVNVNPMQKHLKRSGDIFELSLKLCMVSPSAVMLKRSLLDEVGLFDETLPVCEDYDLWLRTTCRHPVYLIRESLVVKEGGRPDQLSRSVRGMDRYRIKAMLKLINSCKLSESRLCKVTEEISLKSAIYGKGCLKRGKIGEGEYYLRLPEMLRRGESFHMPLDAP